MRRPPAPYRSDVIDPGCVKTHTSAKSRKHNSPARHRTSRVQYDLTLRDAIDQRYFYVRRERWSFRTAKTLSGHSLAPKPATEGDCCEHSCELGHDEGCHPAGRDARKGVGKRTGNGDSGVSEGSRSREPIGRRDVEANGVRNGI